ncbi:NEDD8-conjugating enzyme ubc12-like [Actinia tenebrosa]|uniref:NEDD8-conjugating enzyme ubc12-like n=1 Tax=Actinia tenebrosa TaxID=6105 RepID=A0A6P8IMY3_ACTTE|nr:NEDD8-conjugating enzyme ubc12-like [Actinia tenebrosa]
MCGQLTPLTQDFHRLLKNVKKLSNNQAKVLDFEDDVTEFHLEIKPTDGYYKRGKFNFKVKIENYPKEAPKVCCETRIYHPNISEEEDGDVCLSLFDDWTDQNDLEDCVQGLLFLLYNPNLEDPLNPYFDPEDRQQHESFEEDVKKSLEGAILEGVEYDRNVVEEELENEYSTEINKVPDRGNDEGTEGEEPLHTEFITKDNETTPLQGYTIVKNNELSENDILNTKTDGNSTCHDKIGLQNTLNQPEDEGTKIS